jgi:hypothetical protein
MFDLESSISHWRYQVQCAGIQSSERLDELESHLREEIDHRIKSGLNHEDAFIFAVKKMGRPSSLSAEFRHASGFMGWLGDTPSRRIERLLALAWLIYCTGSFFSLAAVFSSLFYVSNFRLTLDFLFAVLFELIYLRGLVACILLFGGIRRIKERRMIWLIAILDAIGGICVLSTRHAQPLPVIFTILGILSLWLLRPIGKPRPA